MPLYLINQSGQGRLIYASSPQGAKNHVLKEMRDSMTVSTPTPLDVAKLVGEEGLTVETATTGITLPPEHTEPEPVATAEPAQFTDNDEQEVPWEEGATSLSGDLPMGFAEYRA